ncbi:MAG: isoamylase early set domain-containing protein [Streptosporangiaceae bacterium]
MLRRSRLRNGKTRVTFILPIEEPDGAVSVVGDFNDWRPGSHVLRRRSNQTCSVSVDLDPGTYVFRYLAAGGVWLDDPAADRIGDTGSVIEV